MNKDRYKKLLDWLILQTHVVISQPKTKHQQRSYQLSNSIFPVLVVKFGLFSDIRKYLVEIEVLKWSFRLQVLSFKLLKQNAEHFYWKSMKEKKKICGCFAQNKTKVLAPLSIIAEGHQIKFNESYLSSIRLFPNSDLALAKCGAFSIEASKYVSIISFVISGMVFQAIIEFIRWFSVKNYSWK